jgi:hypothetical protein
VYFWRLFENQPVISMALVCHFRRPPGFPSRIRRGLIFFVYQPFFTSQVFSGRLSDGDYCNHNVNQDKMYDTYPIFYHKKGIGKIGRSPYFTGARGRNLTSMALYV